MTTYNVYHNVWLEGTDDAANITMPDGNIVVLGADGTLLVHHDMAVVWTGNIYTPAKPTFAATELALLLDAIMVYCHGVENNAMNDRTDLPAIEALQHKVEKIIEAAGS